MRLFILTFLFISLSFSTADNALHLYEFMNPKMFSAHLPIMYLEEVTTITQGNTFYRIQHIRDSIYSMSKYGKYEGAVILLDSTIYSIVNDTLFLANGYSQVHFYDGSIAEKGLMRNGYPQGVWITYYRGGVIYAMRNYENGNWHGPCVEYYKSENVMHTQTYQNGRAAGLSISFYENGSMKKRGNYFYSSMASDYIPNCTELDSLTFISNDIKNGTWEYFDSLGNLVRTEEYQMGTKVR